MRRINGPRSTAVGIVIAIVVAVSLGAGARESQAQDSTRAYRLDESWPQYPPGSQFEMGSGIAVDARGIVYAISRDQDHWAGHPLAMTRYRGSGSIWMFDRNGTYLGKFAEDQDFIGPHSLYIDGEGFVWVVDRDGHQVKKLTPDGTLVLTLGEYGMYGATSHTSMAPRVWHSCLVATSWSRTGTGTRVWSGSTRTASS